MFDPDPLPVPACIIWTVMAPEHWLAGWDQAPQDEGEMTDGRRILLVARRDGRRQVARLISTDPLDYLNEAYFPGTQLP